MKKSTRRGKSYPTIFLFFSFLLTMFSVMVQMYLLYLLGSHVIALFRGCRSTCIYSAQVSSNLLPAKFYRSHMTSFLSGFWMYLCVISALCILKTENWLVYQCTKMSLMPAFMSNYLFWNYFQSIKIESNGLWGLEENWYIFDGMFYFLLSLIFLAGLDC